MASPCVDPTSNLICTDGDQLKSLLTVGPGLDLTEVGCGEVNVDLGTMSASYYEETDGEQAGASDGTSAKALIGPQQFLDVTNPSADRSAIAYVICQFNSELIRQGSGSLWRWWCQYNIDGGAWIDFDGVPRIYDRRITYSGGTTYLDGAMGPQTFILNQGLTTAQTVTFGMRRMLEKVIAGTAGENFVDSTGELVCSAIVTVV